MPISPGIVPIHNFKQVAGFSKRAGATVPSWLARRFEGLEDDPTTTHLVAAAAATEQVMDLVDEGIKKFHFLHVEPRRSRLRDLPSAGPSPGTRGKRQRGVRKEAVP